MKWFKHESDASTSETVKMIVAKYDLEGEARYWRLISEIARRWELDPLNPFAIPYAIFDPPDLGSILRGKSNILLSILKQTPFNRTFRVEQNGNIIRIECSKLLEHLGDYERNLQAKYKRLASKNIEVEVEIEKDLTPLPVSPAPNESKPLKTSKPKPRREWPKPPEGKEVVFAEEGGISFYFPAEIEKLKTKYGPDIQEAIAWGESWTQDKTDPEGYPKPGDYTIPTGTWYRWFLKVVGPKILKGDFIDRRPGSRSASSTVPPHCLLCQGVDGLRCKFKDNKLFSEIVECRIDPATSKPMDKAVKIHG